jgi:acetyl esterase
MAFLLILVASISVVAALALGLANHWANTPHGRIKPIFAVAFRLAALRPGAERGIGAGEMDSPEATAKIRSAFLQNVAPLSKPVAFAGTIEDRTLPGAPGDDLPVRVYTPEVADGVGPLPLVVYFHGGGFVVGNPDYTDAPTRILALSAPAVVVSVDYRMAPEHVFPAAVEDCDFAVQWCFENAATLGARTGPVAVAGDSAGGNLSAVVAQRDAAAGRGRIGLQALIYPWLDLTRMDRGSHVDFAVGYGLSTKDLEECMRRYVPAGADRASSDMSPLHAKSLAGLAPATVITAGFDPLRDEGIEYVAALKRSGVEVRHVIEPKMPHGFITMTRLCSEARKNLEGIAADVRAMS